MMNVLTIVFLAVAILTAFISYRRGAMKMLLAFLPAVIAAAAVYFASPFIREYLMEKTLLDEKIRTKFEETLSSFAAENFTAELPEDIVLPEAVISGIRQNVTEAVTEKAQSIAHYLSDLAVNAIIYVGTFLVVFLIMKLIFHMIQAYMAEDPVIGKLNGTVGILLGLGQLLLFVWVAMLLITALVRTGIGVSLLSQITESPILSVIYDHNPLLYKIIGN